jgi:predicted RNA-binding protein (virulence factor B family)
LHRHSYIDADTIRKHIHFGKREKGTERKNMGLTDYLGKKRRLMIVKEVEFGVYLGNKDDKVLLPKKQVPKDVEVGDPVEVFLYKDSSDRLIATTQEPKITLDELAVLKVADTGRIGAFLDWGLEKDLLLPFKEQTAKVKKGDEVLVALYVDKSGRLCATMKVYEKLRTDSPYKKDDHVEGIIYETSDNFGVFVAVDDCYSALIPKREAFGRLRVGDRVSARVLKVREDGKLDLSVREKAFLQMDADAAMIMKRMEEYGGKLPFNDKADPEVIKQEFGLSKNAFKRAVGRLLKEGHIKISEKNIEMKKK